MQTIYEYCALIYEDDNPDSECQIVLYKDDGSVRQKVKREQGAELIMSELDSQGWQYAFRDIERPRAEIFFRRPISR